MSRSVIKDLWRGTVLSLSLFLAGITLPVIGLVAGLITPLPIAYYSRKIGRGYGLVIALIAASLVGSAAGINIAAFFLVEFAFMGIALSESVRMKLSLGKGILLTTTASIAGSALLLLSISSSLDKPLYQVMGEQVHENVAATIDAYKKIGFSDEQVQGLTELTAKLEVVLLKVFPSLFFLATLTVSVFNLLALKRLLKKNGIEEYQVEPTTWRSPELVVWILISGGTLLLLKMETAGTIGLNLLIGCVGIYLFQGMAIMAYYFKKMNTPLYLKAIGFFLILFQQIFTIMVIGFGLFDLWFDFRKLNPEKPAKKEA